MVVKCDIGTWGRGVPETHQVLSFSGAKRVSCGREEPPRWRCNGPGWLGELQETVGIPPGADAEERQTLSAGKWVVPIGAGSWLGAVVGVPGRDRHRTGEAEAVQEGTLCVMRPCVTLFFRIFSGPGRVPKDMT